MKSSKIKELSNLLQKATLKGEIAHLEMSPTNRSISSKGLNKEKVRKAAVLIVLFEENEEFYFPLIERHVYEGNHSGEIGLPGGKIEKTDRNTSETALRETEEELGIKSEDIEIVKELTPIYIPPSNFLVTPYIGVLKEKPTYIPDPIEVKNVFDISINELIDLKVKQPIQIEKEHIKATVPSFQFGTNTVWGATACMLNEFKYLLKND